MTLQGLPQPGLLVSSEEVVAGTITTGNPPTITQGSGFSLSRNGSGDYTVTFTTAFSGVPRVIASGEFATNNARIVTQQAAPTTTTCRFIVHNISQTPTEADGTKIHFIAYIPSSGKTRVPREFGLVTSLPTSPTPQTGDMCTLVDSLSSPTYRFRFQYNGSSSSSYKWECIGGSPAYSRIATGESRANAAYGALTTAGPSFTVPVAGDYDVKHGCRSAGPSSDYGMMSYDVGGTGAIDADATESSGGTGNAMYDYVAVSTQNRKTGLAASTALVAKYRTGGATCFFQQRWMSIMPVRVI